MIDYLEISGTAGCRYLRASTREPSNRNQITDVYRDMIDVQEPPCENLTVETTLPIFTENCNILSAFKQVFKRRSQITAVYKTSGDTKSLHAKTQQQVSGH
jgi:hypothetical protein